MVQTGRAGLGWSDPPVLWSKASRKERKDLVASEVTRIEQEELRVKSVAAGVVDNLGGPRLVRVQNSSDTGSAHMAAQPSAEEAGGGAGEMSPGGEQPEAIREPTEDPLPQTGEPAQHSSKRPPSNLLTSGAEWKMKVDLGRQLQFPQEICSTTLRPDVVLWSAAAKSALLTVPWEEGLEAAYERKMAKYADLVADCRESGWSVRMYPVEVGARGFVGSSTSRLLRDLELRGARLSKSTKELSEEAEKASHWLWLRRRDKTWGATST
ncbi:hypothetical protein AAFF_G00062440 [Aldrovandia affinis]|uniref:Uncharacterized protein n=1 Tax=Aldrovandia affinis TaxID=143900 RepID=A0AAD7WE21_9TELE|nr:hypothetical protein AAFF_G00062440 [Aldrovandia affinis]